MDTPQTPQLDHQQTVAFKIWYADRSVNSEELPGETVCEKWKNACSDGVQVVMIYFAGKDGMDRPTRLYSSGCDHYAMDDQGRFTSHFDDASKVKGHVLHGTFMNYEKLLKLEEKAFLDYGEGWLTK